MEPEARGPQAPAYHQGLPSVTSARQGGRALHLCGSGVSTVQLVHSDQNQPAEAGAKFSTCHLLFLFWAGVLSLVHGVGCRTGLYERRQYPLVMAVGYLCGWLCVEPVGSGWRKGSCLRCSGQSISRAPGMGAAGPGTTLGLHSRLSCWVCQQIWYGEGAHAYKSGQGCHFQEHVDEF